MTAPCILEVEDLAVRIANLERQIASLPPDKAKAESWYHTPSLLVSVCALVFSFGTTFVSCAHTRSQDVQATRQDLRALLQRLAALPKENLALLPASREAMTTQQLSSLINQENAILVKQAAELISRIPQEVSSTECFTVGQSFAAGGEPREGFPFLEMAIAKARDSNDEIAARRTYAYNLMAVGQQDPGRSQYQAALAAAEKYGPPAGQTVDFLNAQTELFWAIAESQFGSASDAEHHITNAAEFAQRLKPGVWTDQLNAQIAEQRSHFAAQGLQQ